MTSQTVPVITLDGPAGSGKGTIAALLAQQLGWHLLDSGAIYRVAAHAALQNNIELDDVEALTALVSSLTIDFKDQQVLCNDDDVSVAIRTPSCAEATSKISALPAVRALLLEQQRSFRKSPGLVADGRDMGTVVFPDASLKVFLTASPEVRAERRLKQLRQQGISANLTALTQEIAARDARDSQRAVAPLRPAEDALMIDSSNLTPEEVLAMILANRP